MAPARLCRYLPARLVPGMTAEALESAGGDLSGGGQRRGEGCVCRFEHVGGGLQPFDTP